jgi:rubrerythrin
MSYSADNALQVAMQMEQLGQTFYQSLAAGCGNAQIATLAAKLAGDEQRHLQTFERMRNSLGAEQRGPRLTEEQLAAVAAKLGKLILPAAVEVSQVALGGDMVKVLEMAMRMESDSVAYYSSLTPIVGIDAAILKAVIQEERNHLTTLRDWRQHLGTPAGRDRN